jgi:hypothetical protein
VADTPIQVTGRETKAEVVPSIGEVLSDAVKGMVASVQDYAELAFRSLTNLAVGPRYFQDTLAQMDNSAHHIAFRFFHRRCLGAADGLAVRAVWDDRPDR